MRSLITLLKWRALGGIPTFLVIEGLDGSGKSTLCKQIACELLDPEMDIPTIMLREPGGTTGGEILRRLIMENPLNQSTTALAMTLSRALLNSEVILPVMRADYTGKTAPVIICDRYIRSTFAYQIANDDSQIADANRKMVSRLHDHYVSAKEMALPDFEIVLDVDFSTSIRRLSFRNSAEINRLDIVIETDDKSQYEEKRKLFEARRAAMIGDYEIWLKQVRDKCPATLAKEKHSYFNASTEFSDLLRMIDFHFLQFL